MMSFSHFLRNSISDWVRNGWTIFQRGWSGERRQTRRGQYTDQERPDNTQPSIIQVAKEVEFSSGPHVPNQVYDQVAEHPEIFVALNQASTKPDPSVHLYSPEAKVRSVKEVRAANKENIQAAANQDETATKAYRDFLARTSPTRKAAPPPPAPV